MIGQLKRWIESQLGPKGHLPGGSLTDGLNQQEGENPVGLQCRCSSRFDGPEISERLSR